MVRTCCQVFLQNEEVFHWSTHEDWSPTEVPSLKKKKIKTSARSSNMDGTIVHSVVNKSNYSTPRRHLDREQSKRKKRCQQHKDILTRHTSKQTNSAWITLAGHTWSDLMTPWQQKWSATQGTLGRMATNSQTQDKFQSVRSETNSEVICVFPLVMTDCNYVRNTQRTLEGWAHVLLVHSSWTRKILTLQEKRTAYQQVSRNFDTQSMKSKTKTSLHFLSEESTREASPENDQGHSNLPNPSKSKDTAPQILKCHHTKTNTVAVGKYIDWLTLAMNGSCRNLFKVFSTKYSLQPQCSLSGIFQLPGKTLNSCLSSCGSFICSSIRHYISIRTNT